MKKALEWSFKASIPILLSFIPVGLAYGILMSTAGYNWVWTGLCSLFVFAGSLQMLMVTFFTGGASLGAVAVTALLLNSRHIFYGIPFIDKWKDYGPWKKFLIFALPDEAFSLHVANDFDDGDPRHKKFSYVFCAGFVLFYWVALSILGAVIGAYIPFDTAGIDFALTALFIVILLEQLKSPKGRLPALIAGLCGIIGLILLGPDSFLLPSLLTAVALLWVFRGKLDKTDREAA